VAVDRAGRVYVADGALSGIVIFDRNNKETTVWRGNGQFPLLRPMGLAFDGQQRLFAADAYGGQVVVFSPEGRPVAGFGQGTLGRPGGLAIDAARHRLYVADAELNRVFVFDTGTLALERAIGTEWTGKPTTVTDDMLSAPTNVAVDSQGSVYVVDTFNCRVQVFDSDGTFLRSLGSQGAEPGNFVRPKGIAIDSQGHVYVADSAFNNFQILTPEGAPLMFVGAAGNGPGQFLLPAGMFIDAQDRVYVTEQRLDGGRLQIFQYIADPEIARSVK
jgi:DNA-binding beta-propeller fold protein YncE